MLYANFNMVGIWNWIKTKLFENLDKSPIEKPPFSPFEQWRKTHLNSFKKFSIPLCIQQLIYDLNQLEYKRNEEDKIKQAEIKAIYTTLYKYDDKILKLTNKIYWLEQRRASLSGWKNCENVIENTNERPSLNPVEKTMYKTVINKHHAEWININNMILNKIDELNNTNKLKDNFDESFEKSKLICLCSQKERDYKDWILAESQKSETMCKSVYLAHGYGKTHRLNPLYSSKCYYGYNLWLNYKFIDDNVYELMKRVYYYI